jgi:hypothetical protein
MTIKKNANAVRLGKLGWAKLSPKERSELARAAVNARWAKVRAAKADQNKA